MKLKEEIPLSTPHDLSSLVAVAGPSSRRPDSPWSSLSANGHAEASSPSANGNGFLSTSSSRNGLANGNGASVSGLGDSEFASNGVSGHKHGKSPILRVNLPGTTLYEDSNVDREEFVRLVLQSLRDVGYTEAAATLEAESGYSMEEQEVRQFRQYILSGLWPKAEAALTRLGVLNEERRLDAKYLIRKQKYLELLEARKTTAALYVLRNELAPLNVAPEHLHTLSSFIMCSEPEDVRQRAGWDGASGSSRQQLLDDLHRYIPSSVMIPRRRFLTLLQQAHAHQLQRCIYHNTPADLTPFSLYTDHQCDKTDFPRLTTNVLLGHEDEVWNLEWSHSGTYLASASKDKTAIIWKVNVDTGEWAVHQHLGEHTFPVGCLAWSLDDTLLLTSAEHDIKLWNTKTGSCLQTLQAHDDTVTALSWLPDGSGFISGALDRKVIQWDADGSKYDSWGPTAIRVTDLAVTPDLSRLVTIGMNHLHTFESSSSRGMRGSGSPGENIASNPSGGNGTQMNGANNMSENRMIVYDLSTKLVESSIRLDGELTSVKISQNSQYALINHAPDEIHLWDLNLGRLARKFTGQRQGRHVIRSCFGGTDGNFVVSGSEDGNVYVWHRDTGSLLEVLSGHGEGSVNSVSWNPRNERMFASCSDDHSIRIWEAPPPEDIDSFGQPEHPVLYSGKGKGKTRQLWDVDT